MMAWEIPDDELTERTEIGAGAFGVVMKTRWRGTIVAMKQLHRHLHHDEVAKAEFRTELKLMRQLHHPHIVQFLGTSVEPTTGLVSLIFEFMHSGSLDQFFRKAQIPLSKGHALELALDVARGMSYLHGRKPQPVIHRDLKPGNLMLTRANRLKIGDFGLSKTLSVRNKMPTDIDQNFTMTGETGSYRYMAPEVFRHEFYGPAVDVYASSMIFYQLFCFRQPFYGINPVDAAKMASIDALRPTMSKNLMPPDLARVIGSWGPRRSEATDVPADHPDPRAAGGEIPAGGHGDRRGGKVLRDPVMRGARRTGKANLTREASRISKAYECWDKIVLYYSTHHRSSPDPMTRSDRFHGSAARVISPAPRQPVGSARSSCCSAPRRQACCSRFRLWWRHSR